MGMQLSNSSEAVKKFSVELLDIIKDLRENLKKTDISIQEVNKSWKDPKFVEFCEQFEKDKEQIEPLCKQFEEYEEEVLYPLYLRLKDYEDISI